MKWIMRGCCCCNFFSNFVTEVCHACCQFKQFLAISSKFLNISQRWLQKCRIYTLGIVIDQILFVPVKFPLIPNVFTLIIRLFIFYFKNILITSSNRFDIIVRFIWIVWINLCVSKELKCKLICHIGHYSELIIIIKRQVCVWYV